MFPAVGLDTEAADLERTGVAAPYFALLRLVAQIASDVGPVDVLVKFCRTYGIRRHCGGLV
jgi:hypothetical protein